MMNDPTRHDTLADVLATWIAAPKLSARFRFMSPLGRAGTTHVYVDTADVDEVPAVALADDLALIEIDGNTVNQPLVHRVLTRYASGDALARFTDTLRGRRPGLTDAELAASLYTAVCGWIGVT